MTSRSAWKGRAWMVESPKPATEELEGSVRSTTSLESLGTYIGESVAIVGRFGAFSLW